MKLSHWLGAMILSGSLGPALPAAEPAIVVTPDPVHAGAAVSGDFSGLSFEISQVLPDRQGIHYFRPENKPLVDLFRTLGIKSLRIGGNTADKPSVGIPQAADIDSLFAFAEVAGVKVIYTVRLKAGDPADDARIGKYILDHYRKDVTYLAIGNEPNFYFPQYPAYREAWKRFADAMTAGAPETPFGGPSAGPAAFVRSFITDFGRTGRVGIVATHVYFFGNGQKVPLAAEARERMLSPGTAQLYEKFYQGFVPAAAASGLPYRLEEANNFYNGGAKDVSDTFAAALWGLDLMHWWAVHGARGVNFHTGDAVAAGQEITVCKYAAYLSAADGYITRPLGYAIKAFALGGRGRIVPVAVAGASGINLTAYGILGGEGDLCVTLINKEHGPAGRAVSVTLRVGPGFGAAQEMPLVAPDGDVAAESGVTLGGAPIHDDGSWTGTWTPLAAPGAAGLVVSVPAATALVVELTRGSATGGGGF